MLPDGAVTEGPGYNVFAYLDGRWLTPGSGTLQGITRRSTIKLARQAGQPVQQGRLSDEDPGQPRGPAVLDPRPLRRAGLRPLRTHRLRP